MAGCQECQTKLSCYVCVCMIVAMCIYLHELPASVLEGSKDWKLLSIFNKTKEWRHRDDTQKSKLAMNFIDYFAEKSVLIHITICHLLSKQIQELCIPLRVFNFGKITDLLRI